MGRVQPVNLVTRRACTDIAEAGSESVQELIEEGQYFEAEVLLGVEAADADGDPEELHTKEFPEDEV